MLSIQTLKQAEGNGFEKSSITRTFMQYEFREHCSGLSLALHTGNTASKAVMALPSGSFHSSGEGKQGTDGGGTRA